MKKKIICLFLALTLVSSSSLETVMAANLQSSGSMEQNAGNSSESSLTDTSDDIAADEGDTGTTQEDTQPAGNTESTWQSDSENSSVSTSQTEETDTGIAPASGDQDIDPEILDRLATPELVSAENDSDGVKLIWNAIDGAGGYRIYRKTAETNWTVIDHYDSSGYAGETIEYVDAAADSSGTSYTYSVQAYRGSYEEASANEGSEEYWSDYNRTGISVYRLAAPQFSSGENTASGIELKWNAVQGATKYQLYRKTSDGSGSWELLADSVSTSFTDKSGLTDGTVYIYSVQASRDSERSCFDETGLSVRKFANPPLSKAENAADGVKITWKSVPGAEGYYVYRKTSGSSWVRLGAVASTSYTDSQNLSTGTKYIYTVRAYEGNNRSWYDSKGVSTVWVETPELLSAEKTSTGMTVKWSAVKGATSYRFYRKDNNSSWKVIADTSSTSYTDKSSLASGSEYVYTVRAYKDSSRSYYKTEGITVTNLSNPPLTKAENASGGIKVTWKSVKGAEGYYVYRKTSGSSWLRLASVSGTSYTDSSDLSNGTKYTYTVRAFKGSDRSWYNSTGVSEVRIDAPVLISAENNSGGIKVTWKSVKGATGYRVYRKAPGGSWERLVNSTKSTSYTDKSSLTSGINYIYTVRALRGSDVSWYDSVGVTELKLSNPVLSKAENTSDGVEITWKSMEGVDGYRVYRRTSGKSWERLVDSTTATSYTDTSSLSSGTNYIYTVRAYKGSDWSWYDSGISVTKLSNPVLSKAENNSGGIKVTWKSVKGAASYRIYRKTSGSSWTFIGTSTSTSYTDKSSLASDTSYTYTVRAVKGSDRSWYDSAGVTELKLSNPVLSSAENTASGIKITWKSVKGAEGYRVYRRTSGGSWERLIDSTTATSYMDESSLSSGTNYFYTVRAYKGSDWSWYDSKGLAVAKLSIPTLSKAENNSGGIKVTWKSVKGATSYRIFRKPSGGSWKHIGTTSSTSYTDKSSLTSGSKYYYTVRALKGSSLSWYNTTGVGETKLSIPSLSSAKKVSGGVKVTWGSVKGANGYYVYRRSSGGSWSRIATTTSTSYTDKTSNTNYIYTVRAYKGSDLSWYNSSGVRVYTNAMLTKAQSFSSNTKWLILVDTKANKVGIYYGSKGNWAQKHYWSCTTGAAATPTVKGSFTVQSKGLAFGSGYTCWYYTQFYGNYLFHSVLYNPGSKTSIQDGRLGINASHGCVRLSLANAKWIYDNIPRGTKVYIY